jgi:hypothetical protein
MTDFMGLAKIPGLKAEYRFGADVERKDRGQEINRHSWSPTAGQGETSAGPDDNRFERQSWSGARLIANFIVSTQHFQAIGKPMRRIHHPKASQRKVSPRSEYVCPGPDSAIGLPSRSIVCFGGWNQRCGFDVVGTQNQENKR